MLAGETVYVLRREQTGVDSFNAPTYEWTREQVDNVIVQPGTALALANDTIDTNRPEGVVVAFTCHFPKTYTASLERCRIEVRGRVGIVTGRPERYEEWNTPGKWNMTVYVEANDG